MDHEMCLTWYSVGAQGLGDANLHRNRETLVHFKKVAKMSNFDHKSPSITSAANADLAQVMIDTQHLIHILLKNEQKRAKVVEIRDEGKLVKMRTENSETFMMKTEGQDTTTGYPTLREAIKRTSSTLV